MTEQEMITLFHERYNLSSNANDYKQDDEIYLLLNAATNRIVKQRFTGNNSRQVAFEGDQKRMDDLRTLIKKTGELTSAGVSDEVPNGKQYAVPSDYMFLIKGYCKINTNWISCETLENKEAYLWIQSSSNRPIIREAKIIYEDASNLTILVDPDNYANLTVAKFQYIKVPTPISVGVDCELPNHMHEEVVEEAVSLALDPIENEGRFKTQFEKLKTVE